MARRRSPEPRPLALRFLESLLAEPGEPRSPRLDKLARSIRATGAAGLARMGFDEAMLAAWLGREDLVTSVAPSCDPSARTKDGKAALGLAAESGSLRCVEILLGRWDLRSRDESNGRDPLSIALAHGHLDIARALAPMAEPRSFDHAKSTALHIAAADCPEACSLLIERWDPNALDMHGRPCALVAIERGNALAHGCLRLLLAKSDLSIRAPGGLTLTEASQLMRLKGEAAGSIHQRAFAAAVALLEAEELARDLETQGLALARGAKRL
jgi:hypothetical protein